MNLAIYGGSFDPPHIGHEQIVYKVLETIDIDKLIVVPTFLNPFKLSSHFTPNQRLDMIDCLFNNQDKIEVSSFEIDKKKKVPSIETIEHFFREDGFKTIRLFFQREYEKQSRNNEQA